MVISMAFDEFGFLEHNKIVVKVKQAPNVTANTATRMLTKKKKAEEKSRIEKKKGDSRICSNYGG